MVGLKNVLDGSYSGKVDSTVMSCRGSHPDKLFQCRKVSDSGCLQEGGQCPIHCTTRRVPKKHKDSIREQNLLTSHRSAAAHELVLI